MDYELVDQIADDKIKEDEAYEELVETIDVIIDEKLLPIVIMLLDMAQPDGYDFEEDILEHIKERIEL